MIKEKGPFINEIEPGQSISGLFCVSSKALRQTKSGSPFISMTVMDNTGCLEARVWDRAQELERLFEKGDIVNLQGEAVEFNGQCQLKVNDIKPLSPEVEVDPALFLPEAPIDRKRAWKTCQKAIASIKTPELRRILEELFSDADLAESFCQAPAAKRMHHAYIGGLLEHTVGLIRLSEAVCKLYPHLGRDLLVCASICHDIGKTREFAWHKPPIEYTDEGRLLGHISIGLQMVEKAIETAKLNPCSKKLLALKHLVLSHHGQKEFGSPVLPMTEEAVVFHMLDDLDAKLNFLSGLKDVGDRPGWTDFQRLFERYFYLPPKPRGGKEQGESPQGVVSDTSDKDQAPKDKTSKPAQAVLWNDLLKLDMEE